MSDASPPRPPELPRWVLYGLLAAAVAMLVPYWTWLVLAIWVGQLGRRVIRPLTRLTGRRQRAAALLTALLLALLVVPIGLVAVTLISDAIELAERVGSSKEVRAMFEQLVTAQPSDGGDGSGERLSTLGDKNPLDLLMSHGLQAWGVLSLVFQVAAAAILGLFIFITGVYVVLADGPLGYRWFERHMPLDPMLTRRLTKAFNETGHGLFIGVGGSGLAQAIVATVTFLVIGVPEPFVLGLLALVASVVPSVGTALVWVPVAIGLALTGRTDAAIGLSIVGVAVIGTIDNIVRPVLARWGQLDLPSYLIMVSMFGGLALVGASGLILGPLVLRLAKEVLVIHREHRDHEAKQAAPD